MPHISSHIDELNHDIPKIWASVSSELRIFIFSRIKDESVTEDLLHDVFIKIHGNIDSLKDSQKLKPWIYQITRNQIADHFRNLEKRTLDARLLSASLSSSVPGKFMEQAIEDMVKMLDSLPDEYCDALCNTELKNVSVKEYARVKEISYTAAKSRVQRARKMLANLLMQCCHYEFDRYGTIYDIHPVTCCCCSSLAK